MLTEPSSHYFKPAGIRLTELAEVQLSLDELEALRLADLQGLYHTAAADEMGVSRQTFGRLVADARAKVAGALVQGKAIRIAGGPVQLEPEPQKGTTFRVAVAMDADGGVSRHFGRCAQFVVYQIKEGKRVGQEARENTRKGSQPKGRGECVREEGSSGQRGRAGRAHCTRHETKQGGARDGKDHQWITDTLGDCDAVITAGIGAGANSALRSAGIRPIVVHDPMSPDKAVALFAEGKL